MFRRMAKKKDEVKMLTPRAYAIKHGTSYTTVLFWVKNGLLPGVEKEALPYGDDTQFVYKIPETAPKPDLKPGPKPRKKAAKK